MAFPFNVDAITWTCIQSIIHLSKCYSFIKVLFMCVFIHFYITVSLLWDAMLSYQTSTFIIGQIADLQVHYAVHFEALCALVDLLLLDEKTN